MGSVEWLLRAAVISLALFGAGCATGPNYGLAPAFGYTSVRDDSPLSDFRNILAGGPNDAAAFLGGDCFGFIANAPDFRLFNNSNSIELTFSVESNRPVSLVVNAPDGTWHCGGESASVQTIAFAPPLRGQFDIWVGTSGSGELYNSTLRISREPAIRAAAGPRREPAAQSPSAGTGFFISNEGHLVTNAHVVSGRTDFQVEHGGERYAAELVAIDEANDVAILDIEANTRGLVLASARRVARGAEIFILGYPITQIQGSSQRAGFGRVNALSGIQDDARFIQIDAPVMPGNSGGPVISSSGEVVGIVTARLDDLVVLRHTGTLPEGVTYALKTDYLLPLIPTDIVLQESRLEGDLVSMVSEAEESVVRVLAE